MGQTLSAYQSSKLKHVGISNFNKISQKLRFVGWKQKDKAYQDQGTDSLRSA